MRLRTFVSFICSILLIGYSTMMQPISSCQADTTKTKHKSLKLQWHHEAPIPKKPAVFGTDAEPIRPCQTGTYKCLADFNNPLESKIFIKTGDKRSGWRDARASCLSPSCEMGMNKSGGINPTFNLSI